MQDLEGITVVALEQAVAAPYASARLADAGARVIKIERPEGDFARGYDSLARGESTYFVWLNRGKESLRLDLKNPDDHALLGRLPDRADVFIQNLAPGAIARMGYGMAELRKKRPELITCSISVAAKLTTPLGNVPPKSAASSAARPSAPFWYGTRRWSSPAPS